MKREKIVAAWAESLLQYVEEQCEGIQVISGCVYDVEACALCSTFKAKVKAEKLYNSCRGE